MVGLGVALAGAGQALAPYMQKQIEYNREQQQYRTLAMIAAAQQQRQLNQAAFGQPPAAPTNQTPMPSMLPSLTPGGAPTPAPVNRFGQPAPVNRFGQPAPAQLPVYDQMTQGAQGAGGTGVQQMPDFNPEGSFASTGLSMGFDPSDVGRAMALGSKSDAAQQALLMRYLLGTGKLGIEQKNADTRAAQIPIQWQNANAHTMQANAATVNANAHTQSVLNKLSKGNHILATDVSGAEKAWKDLKNANGADDPATREAYQVYMDARDERRKQLGMPPVQTTGAASGGWSIQPVGE